MINSHHFQVKNYRDPGGFLCGAPLVIFFMNRWVRWEASLRRRTDFKILILRGERRAKLTCMAPKLGFCLILLDFPL